MKTCIKCGEAKSLGQFGNDRQMRDGLRTYCKQCNNAYARAWSKANPEKANAQARRWAVENSERSREIKAASYGKHRDRYSKERAAAYRLDPEPTKQRARAWEIAHPARVREKSSAYAAAHPDRVQETQREYYVRYPDRVAARSKKWRAANPAKVRAIWMRRKTLKMNATPDWLSAIQLAQIEEFYEIAEARFVQTGIKHHVDHIHPLRGRNFRGLHVPWNLQVLTASENLQKASRLIQVP